MSLESALAHLEGMIPKRNRHDRGPRLVPTPKPKRIRRAAKAARKKNR